MKFDLLDFKYFGIYNIDGDQISEELKKEYKIEYLDYWNEFIDYFIKKYETF